MKRIKFMLVSVLVIICLVGLALMLQPGEEDGNQMMAEKRAEYNLPAVTEVAETSPPKPTASAAVEEPETPNMKVNVPDGYVEGASLPVYAAVERDLTANLDPEWFNQSGVVSQEGCTISFADGGELHCGSEALFYNTYDGTYEAVSFYGDGRRFTEILQRPTMASQASYLAGAMISGFPGTKETYRLEQTELSHITLAQAQAIAERLMQRLGMEGYTCTVAIDMSVERIVQMGGLLEQAIENGQYYTNACRYDYAAVTTEDEGFHLQYHKFGTAGDLAGEHSAAFYITSRGIMFAELRERYAPGETLSTPERLLSAGDAATLLPRALAACQWPETLRAVKQATLTWMPCAEDGVMVIRPVWMLSYITEESARQGYACWAAFDAVTGEVRAAIFKE